MLEVLDDLLIREDEEAIAGVLILLALDFGPNRCLHAIDLASVVLFLVCLEAAAATSQSFVNSYLAADGPRLSIFRDHKFQIVD